MKQVIVVSNKKNIKFARLFVHLISKNSDVHSVVYTYKQFEHNEFQIASNIYVIFYGENDISNAYSDEVKIKYNKLGIEIGYTNNIAIINVNHIDTTKENLDKLKQELKLFKKHKFSESLNLKRFNPFLIIIPLGGFYWGILQHKRNKLFNRYQNLLAINYFNKKILKQYLSIDSND